ncbi:MAG: V-type ATPase 116kDa subunit family protein [Thiobacillaceae bacterium]
MFRARPLYHMTLWCLAGEAQGVALLLAQEGVYNPSPALQTELPDTAGQEYRETYFEARSRLDKILPICGPKKRPPLPPDALPPTLAELQSINRQLGEIWHVCSDYQVEEDELEQQKRQLAALEDTYSRMQNLHQNISALLQADSLLKVHIGQVPTSNVYRLQDALELAGNLLLPFDHSGDHTFALIAGIPRKEELGNLLAQAGWRDLSIPPELQTHPQVAGAFLQSEKGRLQERTLTQRDLKAQSLGHYSEDINTVWTSLILAKPMAESALSAVKKKGSLTAFTGWIPHRALPTLKAALDQHFPQRYLLDVREPFSQEPSPIPSLLTYPAWLKPFIPLVRSYGVPRYGEFDPALLFAFSYLLLFGAMFGDVGHGTTLMVLSRFLRGKLAWLRPVGLLAGISACAFGVLYGSVFGFEDLIHPVWMSPMHDATRMLELAILSGVGFISATFVINIYNRLVEGTLTSALFDGRGLAGLLFYSGAVLGLGKLIHGYEFGIWNAAFSLFGLTLITLRNWNKSHAALPERSLVTIIETLETATNLFANTLSFLRVAAFSLNHVALALAVFTLAGSLGTTGHWATIVMGNVVIIVLEGGIVAIQSLRLMYYEGFSRFFSGDGIEFKPLGIETDIQPVADRKGTFAFKSGS